MNNSLITSTANTNLTNDTNTVLSTKSNRMATAIPPSPLKLLRDDSVDGTLSPVSSKSTGTDTDTDTRKKVSLLFTVWKCPGFLCHSRFYVKSILENREVIKNVVVDILGCLNFVKLVNVGLKKCKNS